MTTERDNRCWWMITYPAEHTCYSAYGTGIEAAAWVTILNIGHPRIAQDPKNDKRWRALQYEDDEQGGLVPGVNGILLAAALQKAKAPGMFVKGIDDYPR